MNEQTKRLSPSIQHLTLGAILTALVVVLQLLGSFIHLGMFSISLVLIPIVVGAATCGPWIGAWLGFVFGVTVLVSGDAAAFWAINVPGTILIVLLKGTLCGLGAGLVYRWLARWNRYAAAFAAAIVCPVVNTGVFLVGCGLFFFETVAGWAAAAGFGENAVKYMFLGLAGGNFLFELGFNIVLSPIIVRLLELSKKIR
ncbi:MAG: ECF transporter S component [Clostridiales bacterium]|nr:ECF transporter S component [Clostridiales bacterium]